MPVPTWSLETKETKRTRWEPEGDCRFCHPGRPGKWQKRRAHSHSRYTVARALCLSPSSLLPRDDLCNASSYTPAYGHSLIGLAAVLHWWHMFITSGMVCSQGEDMVAFGSGLRCISFGHTRALGYAANVFLVFLVVSSLPAVLTRNLQGTSNTCLSKCGNITIPYPFGTSPGCGLPEFSLNCTSDAGSNFSANPALLLSPPCGPSVDFYQVTSISANTLIIRATNLVADSCAQTVGSGNGSISVCLGPASAPYVFTSNNTLFAWGCSAWGQLDGDDEYVGTCSINCNGNSQNEIEYCLNYECCVTQFPMGVRNITIYTGGDCGWASVVYPPSHEGGLAGREWGVQLGWAIPGPSCQNATTLGNYSCAATATCQDAQFPGLTGYTCACSAGYDGDGYANGIGCNGKHDLKSSCN